MPAAARGCLWSTRSVHSSFVKFSAVKRVAPHARVCSGGKGRRHGFTLLEILLSIAIIALVASVLIGGSARLLTEQPVTPDEVFWTAVREARKAALKSEREVRLKFDKEKKHFMLLDGHAPSVVAPDGVTKEEAPLKTLPVPPLSADGLAVEFLGASAKGGNAILVGGVLLEAQTIPFVTFYSDGTCTAFRAQISRGGGSHTLSIDPWTCAPVLTPVDPNTLPPS